MVKSKARTFAEDLKHDQIPNADMNSINWNSGFRTGEEIGKSFSRIIRRSDSSSRDC